LEKENRMNIDGMNPAQGLAELAQPSTETGLVGPHSVARALGHGHCASEPHGGTLASGERDDKVLNLDLVALA
jgi:hypothetical protein